MPRAGKTDGRSSRGLWSRWFGPTRAPGSFTPLAEALAGAAARAALVGPIRAAIERLRRIRDERRAVATYLFVEAALVDASGEVDRLRLRSFTRSRAPAICALPSFVVLFETSPAQERWLARELLRDVLARAVPALGADPEVGHAVAWIAAVPDVSGPLPFGAGLPPTSPAEWPAALRCVAERLIARLEQRLGPRRAAGLFDRAYRRLARSYELLESFPSVVGLLPVRLLDAERLALLVRLRRERLLAERCAALGRVEEGLAQRLSEVRRERDALVVERSSSTESLRRAESNFLALIEGSPEAILVIREERVRFVNRSALGYLGYDKVEEILGRPVLELLHPDDRGAGQPDDWLAVTIQGAAVPASEKRLLRRDGQVVQAEVFALEIPFDGRPAIVLIARDLTERRQIQARLLRDDRLTALGTLAAGVAHEINNPLAYVTANLQVLSEQLSPFAGQTKVRPASPADFPTEWWQEVLQEIEDAREGAERVRVIVRDLRAFARGDDGHTMVDVAQVLDAAVHLAHNEIRHRARLIKDYSSVPPVRASESRLAQVFLNLLLNAAQALPAGGAGVNMIRLVTRITGEGRVAVEVSDTGPGIPPAVRGRIFDPFFTTKPIGKGMGLGLAISQSIVAALGGDIELETEVGRGSLFRVLLPAAVETTPAEIREPLEHPRPARRARVLVVDDEPSVGVSIQRTLEADHDVCVVVSVHAALERIRTGAEFDVILCDVMMPEATGVDLHAELARLAPGLVSKLVFVSGGVFTDRLQELVAETGVPLLHKPFEAEELRSFVRIVVEAEEEETPTPL